MASERRLSQAPRPSFRKIRRDLLEKPCACAVESLESRLLLSVTQDAGGFTQVTPSPDSRMIYVSSSTGSDSNGGLSADAPVATIARAYSLLRDGEPDWILFKRGDTFVGSFSYFSDSGRSAQEPMIITNYGDASLPRPVIDAQTNTAFRTGTDNHDVFLLGLNFTSSTHDPTSPDYTGKGSYGLYDLGGSSDLLIENCQFSYFVNDLTFQGYNGPLEDITVRRDEILDAYNTSGHAQGLYADSVTNLTIEDNVFDFDGWNQSVAGAGPTIYNHDCYLHSSNVNCVVTGNTFADAGSFGLEARAGGVVDNNLFINDPYGFAFGLVNGSTAKAGGVSGEAIGNVVIQPRKDGNGWGIGALIGNLSPTGSTLIANNIFADAPGDTAPAMEFAPGNAVSNPKDEAGLHSLLVTNNTSYDWGFGISMSAEYVPGGTGADSLSDVTITGNNFQDSNTGRIVSHANAYDAADETWSDNTYSSTFDPFQWFTLQNVRTSFTSWQATVEPTAVSQAVSFVDPTRTIDTYMSAMNQTGGLAAFVADARQVSDTNWNPVYLATAVIDYIQGGFTIGTPGASSETPRGITSPPAAAAPLLGPARLVVTATTPTAPVASTTSGPNAPTLARTVINYADAKHTVVSSISLVLSQRIVSASAMVSLVENTAAGDVSVTTLVSNPSGNGKNWTVSFFGQTLPAGAYTLTVNGSAISNADGSAMGADRAIAFTTADKPVQKKHMVAPKAKRKTAHAKKSMKVSTAI